MPSAKTSPAFVPGAPLDPTTFPFAALEACYVVSLVGRQGLHEALQQDANGSWIFRALNEDNLPLVIAGVDEVRTFDLPIFHCLTARDRSVLACVVSGDDYDIHINDAPGVAAPLFQAVQAHELIRFAQVASDAGFTAIYMANGHDAWEGAISDLISECQALASTTPS